MATPLTLARFDRDGDARTDDLLVDRLLGSDGTRVLLVDGDAVLVDADGSPVTVRPDELAQARDQRLAGYLGLGDGVALVSVAAGRSALSAAADATLQWHPVREVVAGTSEATAEALVSAVALARWHEEAPFCAACGGATVLTTAGWARRCTACEREHFPRTDPAVIVAVTDGDRLLLGSNAMWPLGRFSCFAGFVEAGESLESAVHREVGEEAGVTLADVRYFGSQGWPYPRSLMLGFHADVLDDAAEADGEEILEVRWFTRDEIRAALDGDAAVTLPGPASIAYRLITSWLEQPA